jgi:hypothetical protein
MAHRAATDDRRHEWGAHARGGWVVLFLWQGSRLSNVEVARLTGVTRRGAQKMMDGLSLHFPIIQVEGRWQWMSRDE